MVHREICGYRPEGMEPIFLGGEPLAIDTPLRYTQAVLLHPGPLVPLRKEAMHSATAALVALGMGPVKCCLTLIGRSDLYVLAELGQGDR
jgi:hypothetical protein